MKIRPVGAELFRAGGRTDGQTDMTKLIVAFGKYSQTSVHEIISFLKVVRKPKLFSP